MHSEIIIFFIVMPCYTASSKKHLLILTFSQTVLILALHILTFWHKVPIGIQG